MRGISGRLLDVAAGSGAILDARDQFVGHRRRGAGLNEANRIRIDHRDGGMLLRIAGARWNAGRGARDDDGGSYFVGVRAGGGFLLVAVAAVSLPMTWSARSGALARNSPLESAGFHL